MSEPKVYTLDLEFKGRPGTIASYLIPHARGVALVETGPGSTLPTLITRLKEHNLQVEDITDVFLTHIHLDHAGASGWLAQHGVRIHVHPNGAPHLLNPEKLLHSASRIYGDQMESLWGQFLSVPEERLSILQDGAEIKLDGLTMRVVEVPGHASHQFAYITGDLCFSGDIGGVRLNRSNYISLPMPPPELNLENWRQSIRRLQSVKPARIAPTHFGVYNDAEWHLATVARNLDQVDNWMESVMPSDPPLDELRRQFIEFERQRTIQNGLDASAADAQQTANPSFMSADGIQRYWKKYRQPSGNE